MEINPDISYGDWTPTVETVTETIDLVDLARQAITNAYYPSLGMQAVIFMIDRKQQTGVYLIISVGIGAVISHMPGVRRVRCDRRGARSVAPRGRAADCILRLDPCISPRSRDARLG